MIHATDKSTVEIEAVIEMLSKHSKLLLVTDFDGTISDFTEDPQAAVIDPLARIALRILAELPHTEVAVISGRSLTDLHNKFEVLERVRLVGSHGHEFDIDTIAPLDANQQRALVEAENIIEAVASLFSGARIERKPHGVVFHYRGVPALPIKVINELKQKLTDLGIGLVREGSKILEYCVVTTNKGDALRKIQEGISPTITVFIGDDITDEAAFKILREEDISIKIGPGETLARHRLASTSEAVQFLIQLAKRRSDWIQGSSVSEIDKHLFLSDLRTCALVDSNGTINWLCTPRIDGIPIFGTLVGGPNSGCFQISFGGEGRQSYLDNSLIAQTESEAVRITDFLDCGDGRTFQRAGRSDLVRIVKGSGTINITFAPKYDFGRLPTTLSEIDGGLRIESGQHRAVLLSPGCRWSIVRQSIHDTAFCERTLKNDQIYFILLLGTSSPKFPKKSIEQMLADTQRFWELWLATLQLPTNHPSLAARSALVLRGLSYGPTGAIAAAATTSLPESIGGIRNWDYRYCWPRDAALAATALVRLGATGPGIRLLDWILGILAESEEDSFLAPLYTVTGKSIPSEAEVPEAFGYRGSRPVRIGNLAAAQLQLDSLAPAAELMWKLAEKGISLTSEHLHLAERLVSLIASRWQEPDSGIWEVRGSQRHFVHSKLMCWYTVSCCIHIAHYMGIVRDEWTDLQEVIRDDIEKKGYDESLQSYIAAYDLKEADAALLWILLSGFHPPQHPRSIGTVQFIMSRLVHDGHVYRYHFSDALIGKEGEFIICRCWLIETLAKMGRHEEAKEMLDTLISRIGSTGLLSEEWDAKNHCALGNYPQVYSHLGLINALCALAQ